MVDAARPAGRLAGVAGASPARRGAAPRLGGGSARLGPAGPARLRPPRCSRRPLTPGCRVAPSLRRALGISIIKASFIRATGAEGGWGWGENKKEKSSP